MHGGSSVESGLEPGALRPQGRDLTTRPSRPLANLENTSPQLDQVQESTRPQKTIGERFMVEESADSVGTRRWTPEGRSLSLSIAFMLLLRIMEWLHALGDPARTKNSRCTSPIPPKVTTPATMGQHNRTWRGASRYRRKFYGFDGVLNEFSIYLFQKFLAIFVC
ncbi:hypothetical protein AVEN_253252-1 [Araneus ventricosus]|uniref:Uncharacterized protein n=1 Tax=Araneus ventricosus TaxID=182803 RepID=A0A4Y2PHR4_ARAVE|nr:hypothetical protein AVEN_253252-1 [Araneus ventricosus]